MKNNSNKLNDALAKNIEAFDNNDKKNSLRHWLGKTATLYTLAGIITVSSLLGGCGSEGDSVVKPTEPGASFEYHEIQKDTPICISVTELGETKFLERYGTNYDDPKYAYDSLYAYEAAHDGESIFINPDYITIYNSSDNPAEILEKSDYDLGFDLPFKMPLDSNVSQEYVEEVFNDHAIKQMDRCLNLIACNPGAEALIQNEFLSQYPKNDPLDDYSLIENGGLDLFQELAAVVHRNGFYVEYSVNPASSSDEASDPCTRFSEPTYFNEIKDKGIMLGADINITAADYSQLDEFGMPLVHTDQLDSTDFNFVRKPIKINDDKSIEYSDQAFLII